MLFPVSLSKTKVLPNLVGATTTSICLSFLLIEVKIGGEAISKFQISCSISWNSQSNFLFFISIAIIELEYLLFPGLVVPS